MSGASGFINAQGNYTFDAGYTDIGQLQFADGVSLSWAEFLQRGLVQHGTPNSIVLGSNYGDRLSGANATLVGGAGGDTYSYQTGDGIVRIKDAIIAGDTNTLKFGAGITAGQIRLGLGSLKLDLGPSASSGQARDEIHLDGFNPDDAFNTSTIQRFEFDGGSTLTTAELLARGFDLDGTAGNDTIGGTGRPHHSTMYGLEFQRHPKGRAHTANRVKARLRVRAQSLVQRFAGQAGLGGDLAHAAGAGSISQRGGKQSGVILFQHNGQIFGNGRFAVEMFGNVEFRQIGDPDFFSHGSLLDSCCQPDRAGNVGGLRRLVAAAQHHDQHLSALHVIHAPTRPEMFAHFKHAFTDRPHVAQIAQRDLAQTNQQTPLHRPVFQPAEPAGEFGEGPDRVHETIVIERLHRGKLAPLRHCRASRMARYAGWAANGARHEVEMGAA
jgi:hypothetical protein